MLEDLPAFSEISDNELLDYIAAITHDMPEIGYNMLRGVLRSQGINVPIVRIQQ